MSIKANVLDISHHNTITPGGFASMKTFGILGVISKASQSTGYRDPTYDKRREDILAAGLLHGAYHFADAGPVKIQVAHFLDVAQPDDMTLLALDYEPNGANTMSIEAAKIFCEEVAERIGRLPVLYSGNLIKEQLPSADDPSYFSKMRLWLAHYNDNPRWPQVWPSLWLHQFSGDGVNDHEIKVPGIAGKVDLNYYAGELSSLAAEWAA